MQRRAIPPRIVSFLQPGPKWPTFYKFRLEGQSALEKIKPGTTGQLTTRVGKHRILCEADFQQLIGELREAERILDGLRLVTLAVRQVKAHPDQETLELLEATVLFLQGPPHLSTRQGPAENNLNDRKDHTLTISKIQPTTNSQ